MIYLYISIFKDFFLVRINIFFICSFYNSNIIHEIKLIIGYWLSNLVILFVCAKITSTIITIIIIINLDNEWREKSKIFNMIWFDFHFLLMIHDYQRRIEREREKKT